MINRDRMINEFSELVAIDSPSYGEREMTDVLIRKLRELGFEVTEDGAAAKTGGNAGNIYAYLPGDIEAEPVLLLGHTDTVGPARGKRAVLHADGRITSAGDTVLGGDDLCAVVEFLEGVRHLREEKLTHRPVEIILMAAEEVFGRGAKAYDYAALPIKSREVYCFDLAGHVGSAALRAPTMIGWKAVLKGRAAHAGFAPETGINAISAAAAAVAKLVPGWVGNDTTMNVGTVTGGSANNVVAESCVVTGEVRSLDHAKAYRIIDDIRRAFEEKKGGADLEFTVEEYLVAYDVPEAHPVVRRFLRACEKLGLAGELTYTLGGSDNNIIALRGTTGIVVACGMQRVHSTAEFTEADDLVNGAALVAELLRDTD